MADMVPDKIEPTKGVGRAANDTAREFILAQVPDKPQGSATGRANLADHRIDTGLIDIHDPDGCPFAGKSERSGPAHSGSRRRDDPNFVLESHSFLSLSFTQQLQ